MSLGTQSLHNTYGLTTNAETGWSASTVKPVRVCGGKGGLRGWRQGGLHVRAAWHVRARALACYERQPGQAGAARARSPVATRGARMPMAHPMPLRQPELGAAAGP